MVKINDIPIAEEYFWDVLRTVYDPEIGVNIVDLGLVHAIDFKICEDRKFEISVEMTLTSPGCPLADVIAENVKSAVINIGKTLKVDMIFVFDQSWNAEMITADGKMHLGLLQSLDGHIKFPILYSIFLLIVYQP
jgi:metal-sulfur cluster biosynthetic enzyme